MPYQSRNVPMNNSLDLAEMVYGQQPRKPPPQMLGTGMAKQAADDISLRPHWIEAQELMAMGEIPQMDYETWKVMKLQQMQQPQQPQVQPR